MKELIVLLTLPWLCKYTLLCLSSPCLSEITSWPAAGRGAVPRVGAPPALLFLKWLVLQWWGCPHRGVSSWSVVSVPSPRAGLGHYGVAAANAASSEDHTGGKKRESSSGFDGLWRKRLQWFMVILFVVPSFSGANLLQQSLVPLTTS